MVRLHLYLPHSPSHLITQAAANSTIRNHTPPNHSVVSDDHTTASRTRGLRAAFHATARPHAHTRYQPRPHVQTSFTWSTIPPTYEELYGSGARASTNGSMINRYGIPFRAPVQPPMVYSQGKIVEMRSMAGDPASKLPLQSAKAYFQ